VRIVKFSVKNYKSFSDSDAGAGSLTPGINVIVGQNNAGKTALLEALTFRFKPALHRSLQTHPTPDAVVATTATSTIDVQFDRGELLGFVADHGGHIVLRGLDGESAVLDFERSATPSFVVRCTQSIGHTGDAPTGMLLNYPLRQGANQNMHFDVHRPNVELRLVGGGSVTPLGVLVANNVANRIYLFGAERFQVGESPFGHQRILAPNAINLPEVLNALQANPIRFRQFNESVRRVLPQVRWISTEAREGNRIRVLVWTIDPSTARQDLAVALNESGTGVGQVLSILYVVMTSEQPQVIAIDEPQSFLHPGAVRKLFEILREYPQHQFIVTTHSPTALTAAEPPTILLVQADEGVSRVTQLDPQTTKDMRVMLADLGVRLEDVFGFDRVLWVEGKTEELCFPLLITRVARRPLSGTAIVGLLATGDFEARHGDLAFDVYRRLTDSSSVLPPAVAFVFDREQRTDQKVENLSARAGGRVHFLPKRMYENYLLHPDAIAAVINGVEGAGTPSAADVAQWLDDHRWDAALFGPGPMPAERTVAGWELSVAGGKVLERLFVDLTETRLVYDKVKHGLELTEWLITNRPDSLRPLSDFLVALLP
jgi:hypothetical protein